MSGDAALLRLWQDYVEAEQEWIDAEEEEDEAITDKIRSKIFATKRQIAEANAESITGMTVQFRIAAMALYSEGDLEAVIARKLLRQLEQMAGLDPDPGLEELGREGRPQGRIVSHRSLCLRGEEIPVATA